MEEGKDLAWVLEEFKKALEKTKVGVGHNIIFDYNIVGAEFLEKIRKQSTRNSQSRYNGIGNRFLCYQEEEEGNSNLQN
jgi:hypothetical protein